MITKSSRGSTLTNQDIQLLKKHFANKDELKSCVTKDYLDLSLDQQKDDIIEEFKKFRSDFYERIDPILKEVKTNREERTIQSEHLKNCADKIEILEKIHPQGTHLATI